MAPRKLSEEQRERKRLRDQQRRARISAEQREARRLRDEQRRAEMSADQREASRLRDQQRPAKMSADQREARRLRDEQRRAEMSADQREASRLRDQQRWAKMSADQREARRLRDQQRWAEMSADQREATREKRRLQAQQRRAKMSAKQREARRLRDQERRERLKAGESRLVEIVDTSGDHRNQNKNICAMPGLEKDNELVCGSDSDCESMSGDYDTEEDDDVGQVPVDTIEANDPAVVADVCRKVNEALAGVCAAQCYVCDRLLNERAKRRVDMQRVQEADRSALQQLLDSLVTVPGQYDVCATCRSYIQKRKVPPSAAVNGFRYSAMPAGLRPLTEVEEHILALRLPFQQIVHLGTMGSRGQYGVRGSVINVPTDAPATVRTVIPLLPEEDELCIVNIKMRLVHKRAYARSFVDKNKLTEWGNFLQNSTLYREHGAVFDASRLDALPNDQDDEPRDNQNGEVFFGQADEPDDPQDARDRLFAIQHSLLMEDRAVVPAHAHQRSPANAETDEVDVAPGEDKTPISVVWDRKAEELAFPGIYLGEPRTFSRHVTRYQAMRSEVRRVDRRGARPQALLYKYNVHAREQAAGRLRHKFKRGAKDVLGKDITREELLDKDFVTSSQKKGLAIPCLLPNSAEYWRGRSHDLFAMVRQLGRPHLFLTLSSAEYHATMLIKVLRQLHQQHGEMDRFAAVDIQTDGPLTQAVGAQAMDAIEDVLQQDEGGNVAAAEKLRLIREDPVVCACYFREIMLQLKKYLRLKKKGPMGRYFVRDCFFRVEFQQRGSPHLHCLLWLNDGLDQPLDDLATTAAFIDELLTCNSTHPLASRNAHKHTSTCFKNKHVRHRFVKKRLDQHEQHRHCRFGAPFWPTESTRIVFPLHAETDERKEDQRGGTDWLSYIEYLRDLRLKLKDVLAAADCPDTLKGVWRAAGCPDDATYELAIRTGVRRPQVLYRRTTVDRWTNPYLRWVLEAFGANTDAQVVLDVYSLVRYCVSYVTKAEKNHSQLHNDIMVMRRDQGFDDRTLMKMLCSRTLRAKETSAQEAAWVLMKFPLSETSRKCTFIDTSPPEQRVHCPKPAKDLLALPAGSTDLWYADVYEIYSKRPEALENVTLAEFVALHHQSKDHMARHKHRIIRYRRFAQNSDDLEERENFFRAMCTLHLPWRNEKDILQAGQSDSFSNVYAANEELIMTKRRMFEAVLGTEEALEEEVQACIAEDEAEAFEADCHARGVLGGNQKLFFDNDAVAEYMDCDAQDIAIDLPGSSRQTAVLPSAQVRRRGVWDRQTYLKQLRQLNSKQKEVVLTVIHGLRTQAPPRLIYIDGAAGTGKSVVARNLANAFETFCPANNAEDSSRVVIAAPTGKAAFNIGGSTMHNVYHLSYNQEAASTQRLQDGSADIMLPLQGQSLANMQNKFANVLGQIVDEVSMVSNRNFLAMDQRCKEAKSSEADFGGLWTIIFGDFRQLAPVGGSPVYVSSTESLAGSALLWQKFEYVELTQNMRQGEDKTFAELLMKIGNAEQLLSDTERALVESRFVVENNLTIPKDCPMFYHQNVDKDAFNLKELMKAPSHHIIRLSSRDRVQENKKYQGMAARSKRRMTIESCENILERTKKLPTAKAHGLPSLLLAVPERPYKLTINVCVEDGLVNGAVGVLKWVQVGVLCPASRTPGVTAQELAVQTLWLRFPGNVGAVTSRAAQGRLRAAIARQEALSHSLLEFLPFVLPPSPTANEQDGLVPVDREDRQLTKVRTELWRHVVRQQFPLVPSLADTIHSSQGSSYDKAAIEYYDTMDNKMVYVALSRVRTLAGTFICNRTTNNSRRVARKEQSASSSKLFKHPRLENTDRRLAEEKQRLRSKPFLSSWQPLLDPRPATTIRIIFHNVQSLNAHHPDVALDEVFMQADVLLLAETWLRLENHIDLSCGMTEVARCDAPVHQASRAGGVAVYSKLPFCQQLAFNSASIEAVSAAQDDHLLVIVVYCHPKANLNDIVNMLQTMLPATLAAKTVLAGDFNVDFGSAAGRHIIECLAAKGLAPASHLDKPTTYAGTTIDAVFCNISTTSSHYQAYYSGHIPLVVDI